MAAGGLARIGFPALNPLFALAAPLVSVATFVAVVGAYRLAVSR
jgi:hypothetical protein